MASRGDLGWAAWVSFHKALPAATLFWCLIAWRKTRGLSAFPPINVVPVILLTALIMQFGGNMLFQVALSYCGLAMCVSITFSTILIAGAICSRIILNEPITIRSILALSLLIVAIFILSFGADEAARSIKEQFASQNITSTTDPKAVGWGILIAACSGASYGIGGVLIRRTIKTKLTVSASLVLISSTGVVVFGLMSIWHLGWNYFVNTPLSERTVMLVGGVFNAIAFLSIGKAFRHLSVIQTNLVNATQIAMASVAGILFFQEPLTIWLGIGCILTIIGLFAMDKKK